MPIALSFLAHPDDAEILCAGTLIRLADAGWQIHIATATPGDCGTTKETRWDISAIRTNEAKRAAAVIGATYHCLDERDGLVVYDKPTVQKATDLFRRVKPDLVFTHAQDDYMMDHVETSRLARAASFLFGAPNISAFPLLPGSKIPHLYYCDPIEGIDSLGRPAQPTTIIDVTAQHEKKLQMLACHASQREWLRAHHGMDEYLEAVRRHDAERGKLVDKPYAEAFVQHRGHAYPREDLLATL
ncbi:MAG TPA: PIG-L deacetylase family protein [Tepidisphaeraceae bacterium]|jgi:LmbE family N-acetylglucosaminyl deacetylase